MWPLVIFGRLKITGIFIAWIIFFKDHTLMESVYDKLIGSVKNASENICTATKSNSWLDVCIFQDDGWSRRRIGVIAALFIITLCLVWLARQFRGTLLLCTLGVTLPEGYINCAELLDESLL